MLCNNKINNLSTKLYYNFTIFNTNFKNNSSFLNLYLNKVKIYSNYIKYNFKKLSHVSISNLVKSNYNIKFNVSDITKYINLDSNNIVINFLRKNKVFNKGRYSRNRQYYRTGAYWCLYVNIVAVMGMYFWFYRINMNFSYLWWLFYLSFASLFISKIVNTNILSYTNFFRTFYNLFIWLYFIILEFYTIIKSRLMLFIK